MTGDRRGGGVEVGGQPAAGDEHRLGRARALHQHEVVGGAVGRRRRALGWPGAGGTPGHRGRGGSGRRGLPDHRRAGRDGEDHPDVDRGVRADQVGEGLAAGLLDGGAPAAAHVVVGESVDGRPRRGGLLGREGAHPGVDPGLAGPAPQAGGGAGAYGPLPQQVGTDPGQDAAGAAAQRCGVSGGEVRLEGGDHGLGEPGGCCVELERHHPGSIGVAPAVGHRRVQAVEPRGVHRATVVDLGGLGPGSQPHGCQDAALGLGVRAAEDRGREVCGVEGDPAQGVRLLAEGAVVGPDLLATRDLHQRGVLRRGEGVGEGLTGAHEREPLDTGASSGPPGDGGDQGLHGLLGGRDDGAPGARHCGRAGHRLPLPSRSILPERGAADNYSGHRERLCYNDFRTNF